MATTSLARPDGTRLRPPRRRNDRAGYLFLLPWFGGMLFTIIPFFASLYLAFTDYNLLTTPEWIGLETSRRCSPTSACTSPCRSPSSTRSCRSPSHSRWHWPWPCCSTRASADCRSNGRCTTSRRFWGRASQAFATTAIFAFISTWNEFFSPLLYLTDTELYTVPLALRQFMDSEGQSQWGQMFAMSVVSLAPVIGFFIAGQKYLIRGIATTGLK